MSHQYPGSSVRWVWSIFSKKSISISNAACYSRNSFLTRTFSSDDSLALLTPTSCSCIAGDQAHRGSWLFIHRQWLSSSEFSSSVFETWEQTWERAARGTNNLGCFFTDVSMVTDQELFLYRQLVLVVVNTGSPDPNSLIYWRCVSIWLGWADRADRPARHSL